MKEYLVSLVFTRGKKKAMPLVVEAVIRADSLAEAKRQLEENDVQDLLLIKYGHSFADNFKPNRVGTEGDFEQFLGIASNYRVKPKG